eukprot:TRINITY_DN20802_c0_g1_i1.p1 TRINITY_DN20802_c0_g1~~TRINITY_DN20802_c0_g1_i1.p1  ORF type:complete len:619 (+),score=228.17 TRINITY_DN20802_c0_g1_i1:198-1859(+)
MKDLQCLILWLIGKSTVCDMPKWIFVKHKSEVQTCVVITLNSLSVPMWSSFGQECMPFLSSFKGDQVDTRLLTPKRDIKHNSFLTEFFSKDAYRKPASGSVGAALDALKEREQLLRRQQDTTTAATDAPPAAPAATPAPPQAGHNNRNGPPVEVPDISEERAVGTITGRYVPHVEKLIENGFVVDTSGEGTEGFVHSKASGRELGSHERLYCVDCEMCLTEDGSELTRISMINWKGDVVYDTLVVPDKPIVDYLTRFSGVTASMLEGVTTRLCDVQQHLLTHFLFEEVVLLGHSLENDLKALKIIHHNVCDTTILYPHFQGPPLKNSLRYLSLRYLRRVIQGSNSSTNNADNPSHVVSHSSVGHCSVEDALAALDLVKMKVEFGDNFGVPSKRRMESMMKSVDGRCLVLENADCVHTIPSKDARADIIPVASDSEAAKKLKKAIKNPGKFALAFADFHGIESLQEVTRWAPDDEAQDDPDDEMLKGLLTHTDTMLKEIYEAAHPNTAFVIMSGQVNGLKEIQDEDSDTYLARWDRNRHGVAFLGVKPPASTAS